MGNHKRVFPTSVAIFLAFVSLVSCGRQKPGSQSGASAPLARSGFEEPYTDAKAMKELYGSYDSVHSTALLKGMNLNRKDESGVWTYEYYGQPTYHEHEPNNSSQKDECPFNTEGKVQIALSEEYATPVGKAHVIVTSTVPVEYDGAGRNCAPLLGAAIFREQDGRWTAIRKHLYVGFGGGEFGKAPELQWISAGPQHRALLVRSQANKEADLNYVLFDIDAAKPTAVLSGSLGSGSVEIERPANEGWFFVLETDVPQSGSWAGKVFKREFAFHNGEYWNVNVLWPKKVTLDRAQFFAEKMIDSLLPTPGCQAFGDRMRSLANIGGAEDLRIAQITAAYSAAETAHCTVQLAPT